MSLAKLNLYFQTLRFVKPTQLYHQLYYRLKNRFFKEKFLAKPEKIVQLNFKQGILCSNTYLGSNRFLFLNLEKTFVDIDWNFAEYGKLWTYNLNYFEFLNQEGISKEQGVNLIKDYVSQRRNLKDGMEPYPISLRGINWVKFLSEKEIIVEEIDNCLYQDYLRLAANLEYHLLANHLLENGFSLLFGAYYFKDESFYKKAVHILKNELDEQILNDGAHFELSPMYHQIMLHRVLDCIQLINLNLWKSDNLISFLESKASKMLSWLQSVTFRNGEIPMVNDSAFGIAPSTKLLVDHAKSLEIKPEKIILSDSGYRMLKNKKYELFIDIGNVGASYQPGHVHSDTFNFLLHVNNEPILIDTGISTYEKNDRRQLERSTASHNTVQIGNSEQTQVWGGFRVAKRAKIINLVENDCIEATHNGFKEFGIEHTRKFRANENQILIEDFISKDTMLDQKAYFHFHPSMKNIKIENSKIIISDNNLSISFNSTNLQIAIESYEYASGFNKTIQSKRIKVTFKSYLKTTISL